MATSTITNNTGASPKEKFDAAVNVIHSLPKQGSFQPSHALMLTFYALYKQASIGPCNVSRPAFWDVVGKVKWDAWNKLGNMKKEDAMIAYVDELKKIIETMPHTDNVQGFVEKLGDFYELVEEEGTISGVLPNMIRSVSPRNQRAAPLQTSEDHSSGSSREGSIDEGLNNLDGPEKSSEGVMNGSVVVNGQRSRSVSSSGSAEMSLSNFEARGSSESSVVADCDTDTIECVGRPNNASRPTDPFNKRNGFHEGEELNEDDESDEEDEEFCDTSDVSQPQGAADVNHASAATAALEAPSSGAAGDTALSVETEGVTDRWTCRMRRTRPLPGDVRRGLRGQVGGSGDTAPESEGSRYRQAMEEQISATLARLQEDVDNVLTRVRALESLSQANQHGRRVEDERAVSKNDFGQVRKRRWNPFPNLSTTSVIFFLSWPFIAHLIIRYFTLRNRRHQRWQR